MRKILFAMLVILSILTFFGGCKDADGDITSPDYNANLSTLVISQGILSLGFSSEITSYYTWEQSSVASITVTPTSASNTASISVNGTDIAWGTSSEDIPLAWGPDNTITIEVTAEDGTTKKTYTISLYRALGLQKTGQTTSYATGDDGDLEQGIAWSLPRFTNNGDGTITDNLTGLMWERVLSATPRNWTEALTYASDLPLASYSDCPPSKY